VVARVAATVEEDEPADGEADVEERVTQVEPIHDTREPKQHLLDSRFEIQPDALLERDEALRVPPSSLAAACVEYELADEQIERIDEQAERRLPFEGKGAHAARHVIG
jgi:hypothetical protein